MDQQNISHNQAKKQHFKKEIIPKAKTAEIPIKPKTTKEINGKDTTKQASNQEQTLTPVIMRDLDTTANPEIFFKK